MLSDIAALKARYAREFFKRTKSILKVSCYLIIYFSMVFINFAACEFAVSICTNHQYLTVLQSSNNKNNNNKKKYSTSIFIGNCSFPTANMKRYEQVETARRLLYLTAPKHPTDWPDKKLHYVCKLQPDGAAISPGNTRKTKSSMLVTKFIR